MDIADFDPQKVLIDWKDAQGYAWGGDVGEVDA